MLTFLILELKKEYKFKIIEDIVLTSDYDYPNEDIKSFYQDISNVLNANITQITVVISDFNAKLGCKAGFQKTSIENEGHNLRNERDL